MGNHLIYSEFFDKYLKGKLSESEKKAFDEKVRQDPLLQGEIKLQKEIFLALGETRKTALKSRLDQVPVDNLGWFSMHAGQLAAVVSAVLVVATGSYFYFTNTADHSEHHIVEVDPAHAVTGLIQENLSVPAPALEKKRNQDLEGVTPYDLAGKSTDGEEALADIPQNADEKPAVIPDITRPDLVTDFAEDTPVINYEDFEAPGERIVESTTHDDVNNIDIENIVHQQYNFHYQLLDNKLFLYGDLSGTPYKIIALNFKNGKSLFLEYNGAFYAIDAGQRDIAPLQVIADSALIDELNRITSK